jgi:nicotinate-nucleotide adenylyltransferase
MKKLYPISFIVIGADNLASLPQWKDFDILNQTVAWIVATRKNERPDASVLKNYKLLPVNVPVSSTDIRAGKGMEYVDPRIRGDVKKYYITKDQT